MTPSTVLTPTSDHPFDSKEKLKEAKKYDNGKERFDLVPPKPLLMIAEAFTYGAKKYADRNYLNGNMKWGRVFAAVMRHLWKWWNGEDNDQESGLHHLAHAGAGVMMLLDLLKQKTNDDRPPASK